jgi:uncharacterized damage-inducible protein DinB
LGPIWIEAFRYHKWANLHLLDVCAKLSPDQLQLTSPGTYGAIAPTLQHLVSAEQRYVARLVGGEPSFREADEFPGIAKLRELAAGSGNQLIEAAGHITADDTVVANRQNQRFKMHLGVVIIQALHHGNDHRTHVCTILGQHNIQYGDMDVWAYGEATGAIVPVASTG